MNLNTKSIKFNERYKYTDIFEWELKQDEDLKQLICRRLYCT